jgi:hypothetical protein
MVTFASAAIKNVIKVIARIRKELGQQNRSEWFFYAL